MDLIAQIKAILEGNPSLATISPLLDKMGDINTGLIGEIDTEKRKVAKAVDLSEKVNESLKMVKEKIGLADGDEFTMTLFQEFLDDGKANNVKALETKFGTQLQKVSQSKKTLEEKHKLELAEKDRQINNGILELELFKVTGEYVPAKNAMTDIVANLKANTKVVDGVVKYLNEDGTILRNYDGVEATIKDKITILQEKKPFLFGKKMQDTGGGNYKPQPNGKNMPQVNSKFEKEMEDKRAKMSYGRR